MAAGFAELARLERIVSNTNACALPGCSIVLERFLPVMWRAVSRGYVHDTFAYFIQNSLLRGFDLGFDPARLARGGRIVHRPYKSAMDNMAAVAKAVMKRVDACKTLVVGEWRDRPHDIPYDSCLVFPCGAVEKNPLYAPGEFRPVSDHTKSGFNPACAGDIYHHVLNSHREVAHFLRTGYVMLVSDVDGAFPILPLAPRLWPYMLFLIALMGCRRRLHLCCHIFADFGTRHAPGAFYIFFVKVLLPMARSEMVLTLSAVVHVDDLALIGECTVAVDEEGASLAEWCAHVAGVVFKVVKTLPAATRQLYIGLWWDSNTRALELEERRLRAYIALLFEYGSRAVLSLQERQSIAGKMQRAALTLPPGAACLIQSVYGMICGLCLPWQRRRTSRLERRCYRTMAELLEAGHGRGLFDRSHLPWAPVVFSDASKSSTRAGGGFVSACGACHWQPYGRSAARGCIDELEGDWVELALGRLGEAWRGMRVPFGVDNRAFERSQARGRSRAERLMVIVRRMFFAQLRFDCIVELFWLSSESNLLADLLSRDRIEEFWHEVTVSGLWDSPMFVGVRVFADTGQPRIREACIGKEFSASQNGDGPRGPPQRTSVPHARASLWDGLPDACAATLERVLDNRLGSSSLRSMSAALKIWLAVCAAHSFDVLIETDHPQRGGRCAAFVLHMLGDTELVWASIENYVWAWREWMVLQRQADPIMGVMGWDRFMDAVKVLTIVPSEPRAELPLEDIEKILNKLDLNSFYEVQFGFLLLVLLFTFSRSECPCPKTLSGFDPETHWQFRDFKVMLLDGITVLAVRFKKIKQDRRLERASARPTEDEPTRSGDWVYVGDVPDTVFSILVWARRLLAFGGRAGPDAPMFLHRDGVRPLTYGAALDFLRVMQARVGVSTVPGLHGCRVTGNNLSRAGNGDELTQFHGGWLSAGGFSRYFRFETRAVAAIPARMLGRPPPGGPAPRDVTRFSNLRRAGPDAGDPVQRLRLPSTAVQEHVESLAASTPSRGAPEARPAPPAAVSELEAADPRGEGVLIPPGFACEERVPRNPRSDRSRVYKVYVAPDGTVLLSRAAAWRHHGATVAPESDAWSATPLPAPRPSPEALSAASLAASLEEGRIPAGVEAQVADFSEFAGGAGAAAGVLDFDGETGEHAPHPPVPSRPPASVAQLPSARPGPSSSAAALLEKAISSRPKGKGSRMLGELA